MAPTEAGLLVRAAAAGDEESWVALVDRYSGLAWSVARSYRLDDASTADVVQDAWLRLAQNLDRIRDPERVGAWLATTVKHEALRVLRNLDRQQPTSFDEDMLPPSDSATDERLLRRERDDQLIEAFATLPDRCQQLLRLLLAEPKLAYEDIAAMMEMPVGSIGPTRARCLEKLRATLAERGAP